MKKPLLLIGAAVIAAGLVIWCVVGAAGVSVKAEHRVYPRGTASISCPLRNRTLRMATYGERFYVERLEAGQWVGVNASGEAMNFHAIAYLLQPLSSGKRAYPVWIYTAMDEAGDYRLVVPASVGNGEGLLYCPFRLE